MTWPLSRRTWHRSFHRIRLIALRAPSKRRRVEAAFRPAWTSSAASGAHREQPANAFHHLWPHVGLRIDEDEVTCVGKRDRFHSVASLLRGRLVGRRVCRKHLTREEGLWYAERELFDRRSIAISIGPLLR